MQIKDDALKILRFLTENNILEGNSVTVSDLIDAIGISENAYMAAESYLFQKKFLKGTIGGKGSHRWVTAEGVDFLIDVSQIPQSLETDSSRKEKMMPDTRKVFVVHGRDEHLRGDFFSFLRSLNLQPIEWSEALSLTRKASPYIGEVLDNAFNNAQAIVVLLTPDDEVRLAPDLWKENEENNEKDFNLQARPNVLFEAGMAFGKNPNRTVIVEVGRVKVFSDVAGRHTVRLTNTVEARKDLAERLRTSGCAVSTTGQDWLHEGDFTVNRTGNSSSTPESQQAPTVKWVDLRYPHDSGLQANLEKHGYVIRWSSDDLLARRLDIEGWSLVQQEMETGKKVSLKVKDRPYNQTLIMKNK